MDDMEKLVNELNDCLENQHISFIDCVGDVYAVSEETIRNVIALLKEQEADIIAMSKFLESHGWDSDSICGKLQ